MPKIHLKNNFKEINPKGKNIRNLAMSDTPIQYIKDSCHLHKLEDEYKKCEQISQAKYEDLRRWIAFMTWTYPQFRKEL